MLADADSCRPGGRRQNARNRAGIEVVIIDTMAEATENQQTQDVVKPATPLPELPTQLPILPMSDVVVFPHMVAPLLVSNAQSIRLIDDVVAGHRLLAVTLQTDPDVDQPRPDQLHPFGCIARVVRMLKFPDDSVRVLIQGLKRMRIVRVETETPYLQAQIAPRRRRTGSQSRNCPRSRATPPTSSRRSSTSRRRSRTN